MMMKKLLCVVLAAACLMAGCAINPMAALYDNDKKIASSTNTY